MRRHLWGTGIVLKCIFAFIFCVGLTQIEVFAAPGDIAIDATHFPDANFRAYVADFDTNKDNILSQSERDAVTSINVTGKNISSLQGVEHFIKLTSLNCGQNNLTGLDVSSNKTLKYLYCEKNEITSLNVSSNMALIELECTKNRLTELDVSRNTALIELKCGLNELTSLDLSSNAKLEFLEFFNNQLTSIDCSNNSNLNYITSDDNQRLIELSKDNTFDLSTLPGFDVSRASDFVGGTVNGSILTATAEEITYEYAIGKGRKISFKLAKGYRVKFDSNGGQGAMDDIIMGGGIDKALLANTFTKENHTFIEWNTKADGSGTAYTDGQVVNNLTITNNDTVTLYAQWQPNSYTVKFDSNNGTGTPMEDLTMTYDMEKVLTASTFTKRGYTFNGWNTEADGSGTAYTEQQSVKNMTTVNNGIVTLYAQWKQNEVTIQPISAQPHTGTKIKPPLTVKDKNNLLKSGVDYDAKYSNNIQSGTATVTVTFKGDYKDTKAKTVHFTIKKPFRAKGLWVSKHENTYVTFNWTGTENNRLATAWHVQYRTKMIGSQYPWTAWTNSPEGGKTLSKRVYLKPNYTIEFKVKHVSDATYLRSVFTTPAGGMYQSITQCRVKVIAVASGALYRKGTNTQTLKKGTNFTGDAGNIIYIKKGTSIKIAPNHVYPRADFSMSPRLYPNHAWYDVANSSIVSATGASSTAGMKDGAVTIRGLKTGTTTVKVTSCNGRGATLTIVVK